MPLLTNFIRMTRPAGTQQRLLAKRRVWFADEGEQQNQQDGQQPQGRGDLDLGKYEPQDIDSARRIIGALIKRNDEADTRLRTFQERLDALEGAREKDLEAAGQHEQLAKRRAQEVEALKPYKQQAEDAAAFLKNINQQQVSALPEQWRRVVPDFGDTYEGQKKLAAWLSDNVPLLVKPPAPKFDAGAGGDGAQRSESGVTVTDADRVQAAAAQASGHKVTPEQIAARRAEREKR